MKILIAQFVVVFFHIEKRTEGNEKKDLTSISS